MRGFRCPKCGELTPILPGDGGARLARERGVPFLGSIPIDPQIAGSSDDGRPFVHQHPESRAAEVMREIARPILELAEPEPSAASKSGIGA